MSHSECIIFAFRTFRESADAVLGAVESECLPTACDDLMGIGLMADVKDDLVLRCVVNIVESDNQFNSSEARSKVTGVDSTTFNHVLTDLLT